jgi:indolepyruvate ferredoxin oxidoreductase
MRRLRGTALDVFGRTAERRMERRLIIDYEALVNEILTTLAAHNHAIAVEIASIPEHIRGYGHVKERHLAAAKAKEAALVAKYRDARTEPAAQRVEIAA